jgi:probable HAF family extracellular repeat protein
MKRKYGPGLLTLAAAATGIALPPPGRAEAPGPPAYVVYDTGTLGGTFAFGAGVSNVGWVTGASTNAAGTLHATLSIPGNVIDLGSLGGAVGNSAVEWPVKNNHGVVVGISQGPAADPLGETFSCADFIPTNGDTCLPFLWQNGALSQLPLLGGNNGFATEVNNAGVAVGWAETDVHDRTCVSPQVLQFLAVAWGPGANQTRILPPVGSDSTSAATAINDAGEVVGISGDCDVAVGAFSARHAVLWVNGRPIKLPTLGGQGWNTPMAISNSGIIVGFSDTPGDVANGVLTANSQAALWTPAGIVNLHTLPGDATAQATGVNDLAQIVGTSFAADGSSRVFLWETGTMYDLNALVQPEAPLYLLATGDINDQGVITGLACIVVAGSCGSEVHTFIAIPAPAGSEAAAGVKDRTLLTTRPLLPASLRERLAAHGRLGRGPAARIPAE